VTYNKKAERVRERYGKYSIREDKMKNHGKKKSIILLEGSKALPICPSDRGSVKVKTL
jgi:hypothetical protein